MKTQLIAIANRKDYDAALTLLDALMDSTRAEDVARARAQAAIIAAWEAQISPIRSVHPVDAIKFRMDQMGMTEKDLARILGSARTASDILRRKRKLSLATINRLRKALNISADVLIRAA